MNVLAIIPARKGSKTVKRKNIKTIFGKPLIEWTFLESKNCDGIDNIVVSTNDEHVKELSNKHNINCIDRDENLCADNSTMIDVVEHVLSSIKETYDAVLILQPTSPFRTSAHIDSAILKFKQSDCDSLVSVYEAPHQFSVSSLLKKDDQYVEPIFAEKETYHKQSKVRTYARNGAIYITKVSYLQNNKSLIADKCAYYLMKEEDSLDLDTDYDFLLAEFIKSHKDFKE